MAYLNGKKDKSDLGGWVTAYNTHPTDWLQITNKLKYTVSVDGFRLIFNGGGKLVVNSSLQK
jgi:hypothetical protein